MGPSDFAALEGVPNFCALARDADFRLLWCNPEYARLLGTTPERLKGQTLADILPPPLAEERMRQMRPALESHQLVAYQQFWVGQRWLTRVWPLRPEAFGVPGYFVAITRLSEPVPGVDGESDGVRFIRSADLGQLDVLSPRELEVFYYLATGMSAGDVAKTLFRSEKTIGRHVENIHRKMGYTNRAQLVRDAVESGLVTFTSDQWRILVDPRNAAE
jgi:PAS domain S-box-containing protein